MAQRGTQRARDVTTTTAVAAGARAATEALFAPLVQLLLTADDAKERGRLPRALELYERALAYAEASLPQSTLLVVTMLKLVISARMTLASGDTHMSAVARAALGVAAWRSDGELLRLSQRCLGLLRARWRAGTLLTPTPEEAYFADCCERAATTDGVGSFAIWAYDALRHWPVASSALAAEADCLHGIHEALCAAIEMWTRGLGLGCAETTLSWIHNVLKIILDAAGPWLPRLRDTCGLSDADEAKMRNMLHELVQGQSARDEQIHNKFVAFGARATADVARHGLRRCALPSCNTEEPAPKTYKLCGRCRGAAYCCAAHSKEDWKRHKREDGCEAPA
jgi:hypothetical protein